MGDRIGVGCLGHGGMKRSIEACYLLDFWQQFKDFMNKFECWGVMQRCKSGCYLDFIQGIGIQKGGLREFPTMHHPVADYDKLVHFVLEARL